MMAPDHLAWCDRTCDCDATPALEDALRAEVERLKDERDYWRGRAASEAHGADRLRAALEKIEKRLSQAHHVTVRINGLDEDGGWICYIAREALKKP